MNREQAKIYASLTREQVSKINDEYGKLYDLICAYADGATIEMKLPSLGTWSEQTNPHFDAWSEYRVKTSDAEKPNAQWMPEPRGSYFFVKSTGEISKTFLASFFDYKDQKHIDFGNCFRTSEEAEAARERVRAALKGETISKTEKVESLDGHELSDAEKGIIRILRRCKVETMWSGPFVYLEGLKTLSTCNAGVLFKFELDSKASEFGDFADDVIDEAEERREKGEPSW